MSVIIVTEKKRTAEYQAVERLIAYVLHEVDQLGEVETSKILNEALARFSEAAASQVRH